MYFVRSTALSEAAKPYTLIQLDISATGVNCLPVENVKLNTAVRSILKELKFTIGQKLTFRKEFRALLIGLVRKMQERSPLSFALVRSAAYLNPFDMACKKKNVLKSLVV